jgi:hypothetical protein
MIILEARFDRPAQSAPSERIPSDHSRKVRVCLRIPWHSTSSCGLSKGYASILATRARTTGLRRSLLPVPTSEDTWGSMAEVRDKLLQLADERDALSVAAFTEQLEQLGPAGLWRETARGYLCDHGFVQSADESLAQTMARALGNNTDELRVCIAENRIGSALLDRFREPLIAADNTR